MTNYLLYDGNCPVCTNVAQTVEESSQGWLTVRPSDDPELAPLVAQHGASCKARPRLVMMKDGKARVLEGPAMTLAMIKGMGLRRALKVSRIVRDEILEADPLGRRTLLRAVGAGVMVATGLALGGSPAAAAPEGRALRGEELARLKAQARNNPDHRAALKTSRQSGYATSRTKSVGFDLGDEGFLLMTFIAHGSSAETRAAVVSYVRNGLIEDVTLETVEGTPSQTATADGLENVLTIASVGLSGDVTTQSKKAYFACMVSCLGVKCGNKIDDCAKLRFLYLVLACIVGVCGSKTKGCHKVCKKRW